MVDVPMIPTILIHVNDGNQCTEKERLQQKKSDDSNQWLKPYVMKTHIAISQIKTEPIAMYQVNVQKEMFVLMKVEHMINWFTQMTSIFVTNDSCNSVLGCCQHEHTEN